MQTGQRAWQCELSTVDSAFLLAGALTGNLFCRRYNGRTWATVESRPSAPEIVLPSLDYCIHQAKLTELNPYGFKASYNPPYPGKLPNRHGWMFIMALRA